MFSMRLQGGAPIYEQLEQRITELILSGEMTENEKLPAVREIAKQLSINPNTVQRKFGGEGSDIFYTRERQLRGSSRRLFGKDKERKYENFFGGSENRFKTGSYVKGASRSDRQNFKW